MRSTMLACVFLLVAFASGCTTVRTEYVPTPVVRPVVDARLLQPCADPVPARGDLTAAAIAPAWQRDRDALRVCKARHASLARVVQDGG